MRPFDAAARRILAWSARHAEPSRVPWIDALRGELDLVQGGPARLLWALGGISIVCSTRRTMLVTRIWRSLPGPLRVSAFGLALGLAMVIAMVWTNAIVPDHESNDKYAVWYRVFYLAPFAYFAASGFVAARGGSSLGVATLTGAVTAVVSVAIILLTFVVIDNLFLSIVMTQPDQASDFARWAAAHPAAGSGLTSQRDYVNRGNYVFATVLPIVGGLGAIFGMVGGLLGMRRSRRPATAA